MELLVLSTLQWRMQAVTPFSYLDYFLCSFNGGRSPGEASISRSVDLILRTTRGLQLPQPLLRSQISKLGFTCWSSSPFVIFLLDSLWK